MTREKSQVHTSCYQIVKWLRTIYKFARNGYENYQTNMFLGPIHCKMRVLQFWYFHEPNEDYSHWQWNKIVEFSSGSHTKSQSNHFINIQIKTIITILNKKEKFSPLSNNHLKWNEYDVNKPNMSELHTTLHPNYLRSLWDNGHRHFSCPCDLKWRSRLFQ